MTELLKFRERRLYILHGEATPLIDVKLLHMLVLYLDIQIPGHGDSIEVAGRDNEVSQVEGEAERGHVYVHEEYMLCSNHIYPEWVIRWKC